MSEVDAIKNSNGEEDRPGKCAARSIETSRKNARVRSKSCRIHLAVILSEAKNLASNTRLPK